MLNKTVLVCLLMMGLAACSGPVGTVSSPRKASALADGDPSNIGKKPRKAAWQDVTLVQAISYCYGATDTPEAMLEEARDFCKGGEVKYYGQDTYLRKCPLFQPHRITFICYPGTTGD